MATFLKTRHLCQQPIITLSSLKTRHLCHNQLQPCLFWSLATSATTNYSPVCASHKESLECSCVPERRTSSCDAPSVPPPSATTRQSLAARSVNSLSLQTYVKYRSHTWCSFHSLTLRRPIIYFVFMLSNLEATIQKAILAVAQTVPVICRPSEE